MTQSLLILADDLTGAADTAARCHQAGLPAAVFLTPPAASLPTGAVALTSDSRHLLPDEAARRVREMMATLPFSQDTVRLYKKIDSTLRGHIGSELDALLAALPHDGQAHSVVICPAFPAQGRRLIAGRLVMDQDGAPDVHLPTLLEKQSTRRVWTIGLATVQAGVDPVMAHFATIQAAGGGLIVVDAAREDDLRTIVDATQRAMPHALFCGSAGLASAVAAPLATGQRSAPARVPLSGPTLFVVGSGSEMARQQLAALGRHAEVVLWQIEMDEKETAAPTALGRAVGVHLPRPAAGTMLDGPQARRLAQRLAEKALPLYQRMKPDLVVLVGGDTAMSVLARLGIARLDVVRELMPGIPLTRAEDSRGRVVYVVLKPGTFGDERTLVDLLVTCQG